MERKQEPGQARRHRTREKQRGQTSSRFAAISPNTTMNPEPIPAELNTTCTEVNAVILKHPF